jgi:hypothetical protein
MRRANRSPRLRRPVIAAFVLDAIAVAAFVSTMMFRGAPMSPRDAFVLSALLFGSFSALGSMLIEAPAPRSARTCATPPPERRRLDRRVIDRGSPTGVERRSGRDRRVAELALAGIFAPRPELFESRMRS